MVTKNTALSPINSKDMSLSTGYCLQRVMMALCLLQMLVTVYVALAIFNSAFSTVKDFKGYPQARRPSTRPARRKFGDFDIGAHEADIVLAQQDVKPHRGQELQWLDAALSNDAAGAELPVVEIWSKAAIGTYLWHHILEGTEALDDSVPGTTVGQLHMIAFHLRYRSGPGLVPDTVSSEVKNLVLVVNGRTREGVQDARNWLEYVNSWPQPPTIILAMLGNERCENGWVSEYVFPAGPVVSVLLTYDDPLVDNKTYHQWPLGVATYRQFPVISEDQIKPEVIRKYVCNFQATLHTNTSRVQLHRLLEADSFSSTHCLLKARKNWVPNESTDSMADYVRSLLDSDLTLCPAGINTETYRVYEALSAGSVPVVEDVVQPGKCAARPWRLLKRHGPPVQWIKEWNQLPKLLAKERRFSPQYKALRRLRVSQWYEWFKLKMRDKFVSVVTSSLLQPG